MNWIFCWLPFEFLGPPARVLGDVEPLQPLVDLTAGGPVVDAVQAGEEDELVEDRHPCVEAALLGQVAPRPPWQIGVRHAAPGDRPGVRLEDAEDDAHGRRLARPVRAEEAEHLAGLHAEADAIERDDATEPLAEAVDDEGHPRRIAVAPQCGSSARPA